MLALAALELHEDALVLEASQQMAYRALEHIFFGRCERPIIRAVGASNADMEKGQMRVEVNISLRPVGENALGTKVEIKNINSFKFATDAAAYETRRQAEMLERGETIAQETRGWNEHKGISFSQ